jgi:hypothetical protein
MGFKRPISTSQKRKSRNEAISEDQRKEHPPHIVIDHKERSGSNEVSSDQQVGKDGDV